MPSISTLRREMWPCYSLTSSTGTLDPAIMVRSASSFVEVREVLILGIQPSTLSRSHKMSEPVEKTVQFIAELLSRVLPETSCGTRNRIPGAVPGTRSHLTPAARYPLLLNILGRPA